MSDEDDVFTTAVSDIKIEPDDTETNENDAFGTPPSTSRVRFLSEQFEKKRTKSTTTTAKMTSESMLKQVEVKNALMKNDFGKLEDELKKSKPDKLEVEVQLKLLKSQVEALHKLRQLYVANLLKEKKYEEYETQEKEQWELSKRYLTLESKAEPVYRTVVDPTAESTVVVISQQTELALLDQVETAFTTALKSTKTSCAAKLVIDTRANLQLLHLHWEEYLVTLHECIEVLRRTGAVQKICELKARKIELCDLKLGIESSCKVLLPSDDTNATPADLRSFRYNRKDMPKLTGSVKDWLPFWALFKEIDDDRQLSDVQKLQLLIQSTKEGSEPREVVCSYTVTGNNYKAAFDHLKNLYGRENVLIKVYVRELLQMAVDKSMGKQTDFRKLVTAIRAQIQNLQMLKVTGDTCDQILYPIVEASLPKDVMTAWQHHPSYADDLETLLEFMVTEVNHETERELAQFQFQQQTPKKPGTEGQQGQKKNKTDESVATTATFHTKSNNECVFCQNKHQSRVCRNALKMTMEKRKEILKTKGSCFVCLEQGHKSAQCPNRANVTCEICSKAHHSVLCYKNNNTGGGGSASSGGNPSSDTSGNRSSDGSGGSPSLTQNTDGGEKAQVSSSSTLKNFVDSPEVPLQIIPIVVHGTTGKKKIVRALIDTGSQRSYILESVHNELMFQKVGDETVSHQLFGGHSTQHENHEVVKIEVAGINEEFPCNFSVSCVRKITGHITQPPIGPWVAEFKSKGVIFPKLQPATTVEVLIGNDVAPRLYTGRIEDLGYGPVAMQTKWGWVLCGKLPSPPEPVTKVNKVLTVLNMFTMPLTALWDLDVLGITDHTNHQTKDELAALTNEHFQRTIVQREDQRYEVALPFLEGSQQLLPTNYAAAERRLISTTRKLQQEGHIAAYHKLFQQWETNKMIKKTPGNKTEGHFLPHRHVVKLSSSTTPIRPVFDASAKPKGRPSLNDCLETGPNYLEQIPAILTRFRTDEVGVLAKAFQQISIREQDRKFLKFLWWADEGCKQVVTYEHCRVVFGITCSPFQLVATLLYHLNRSPEKYKQTADRLIESMYVDNLVTSVPSIRQAENLKKESEALLLPAQFDLRGWEFGPREDGATIPVLGLLWNMRDDYFTIDTRAVMGNVADEITQRYVIACVHALFDPLGFISPFVIIGKLILRKCHEEKLGWDKPLPTKLKDEFVKWRNQIPDLENVKVPRFTHYNQGERRSLHFFSDASGDAYAAAGFLRVEVGDDVRIRLLFSKTRVAPKKTVSIPRLELIGCLMGVRLSQTVRADLRNTSLATTYWTDSTTAIAWIVDEGPWGIFVDNRVREIRSKTKVENWRHVPGKLNPADLPSRGCSAAKLALSEWWLAPAWLYGPPDSWPRTVGDKSDEEISKERKKVVSSSMLCNSSHPMDKFLRISSYPRIVQAVATWVKFKKNLLFRTKQNKGQVEQPSDYENWKEAENIIFQRVQIELMEDKNRIRKLHPFKDENGVVRTRTRLLENDEIDISPIILPDQNEFVKRMIRRQHEEMCHAGTQLLLAKIRERFWLINGRRAVRRIVRSCWVCKRYNAKRLEVPEAPLPITRTATGIPFSVIGVDLAGPLIMRDKTKMWIALFTCASYRALHLEIVDSLSTDEFLLAFRRFASRRGKPSIVYSDNGLNFVGASTALRKVYERKVDTFAREKRIDWRHNPPTASWWGGIYERLIGLVKTLMRRMLGKRSVHKKELEVLLLEVEETLNNRPLTYLPESPEDPQPLTPNMLVRNSGLGHFPELNLKDAQDARGALRRVQRLRESLCSRFRKEYLGQLAFQRKTRAGSITIKPGDVVLIEQENEKRQAWPLARVLDAIPGVDGIERMFRLQTRGGIISRPAQRLFPMELNEETPRRKQ